jgi:hypothetical protein
MFTALANLAHRRGRRMVIGALLVTVVAAVLGFGVADRLQSYGASDPATDSAKATAAIAHATGRETAPGMVVMLRSPGQQPAVERVLRADSSVAAVASISGARDTFVTATFRKDRGEDAVGALTDDLQGAAPGVKVGGQDVANNRAHEIVGEDLSTA